MSKLGSVRWMHWSAGDPGPPIRARVWRVTSCDAMHVLQLTFAPWALEGDTDTIECSHLAVVNAIDRDGQGHVFYVHEQACMVQRVYMFTPGPRKLWMGRNDEAPMGFEADVELVP